MIRSAANVLSDATRYTSVIVAPKLGALRIKHVQLVPVAERTALIIIVTNAGIVKDAVIRIPEGLDADHLYNISRTLTEKLGGQPLDAVRQTFAEMLRDAESNRRLLGDALNAIEQKLGGQDAMDVVIGGGANLLNYPEYSDVEKAKNFFAVLESKTRFASWSAAAGAWRSPFASAGKRRAGVEGLLHCDGELSRRRRRGRHAGRHRADADELQPRDLGAGFHGARA